MHGTAWAAADFLERFAGVRGNWPVAMQPLLAGLRAGNSWPYVKAKVAWANVAFPPAAAGPGTP